MKFLIICAALLGSFLAASVTDELRRLEDAYRTPGDLTLLPDGVTLLPINYEELAAEAVENFPTFEGIVVKPGVKSDNQEFLLVAAAHTIVRSMLMNVQDEKETLLKKQKAKTIGPIDLHLQAKQFDMMEILLRKLNEDIYGLYGTIQP